MPAVRALGGRQSAQAVLAIAALALACSHGGKPPPGTAPRVARGVRPGAVRRAGAAPGRAPVRRTFGLTAGPCTERALAGGETDVYAIDLAAGQYLGAVVDQLGIDVYVAVVDPEGHLLFHVDRTNGANGPEAVDVVAENGGGRFRLEVGAAAGRLPGKYCARIVTLRPAVDRDRLLYRAERAFFEARAIHTQRSPAASWEAAAKYEQAARLFRELGAVRDEADALFFLGRLYLNLRQPAAGQVALERARGLYAALGDRQFLAQSLNTLGICDRELDDFAGAQERFGDALRIWTGLQDRAGEAAALLNQGNLDQLSGRRWDALNEFRGALDRWHQVGGAPVQEINALGGMAWVYESVGDWEPALGAARRMLAVARSAADAGLERRAMTVVGGICIASGRPIGIAFLRRALQGTADEAHVAAAWNGLGVGLRGLGLFTQARDAYQEALRRYQAADQSNEQATAWINLGQVDAADHRSEEALGDFRHAFLLGREHRDPLATVRSLAGMAQVEAQSGRVAVAQAWAEEAIDRFEALRTAAARSDLRISYLGADEPTYDLLIRVLMLRHRQLPEGGYDVMALARSDQSRARDLLDQLAASGRSGVDSSLAAERRHLLAELARLDAAAHDFSLPADAALAAARAEDAALDRLSDVDARLHVAGSGARAARPADPREIQRLRQSLDPDTVVLEYHLGAQASFLWAISKGAILSFELPGRDSLEPLIRATRAELLGELPEGGAAVGGGVDPALALSRNLLGPVAAALGGKRLLIAADGALQSIPFAALPDLAGGGPLLLHHQIATIPSLSVLAALQQRPSRGRDPDRLVAILADPVFAATDRRVTSRPPGATPQAARQAPAESFLPRLASSRSEADAIAALAGPGRALEAVDFAASPSLVASGRLYPYSILHFATHGELRSDRPELSALVLSRVHPDGSPADGYLRVSDIEGLDLPADLVVLSACDTAGSDIAGEGLVGLPQAFLIAGARQVVVTLWAIDDGSSAALMQEFYRLLLGRPESSSGPQVPPLAPAEALQQAQISIRRIPKWASPRHWAGFVLTGAWP